MQLEVQLKKKSFNIFDTAVDFFDKESNDDHQYFKETLLHKLVKDVIETINKKQQIKNKYRHYMSTFGRNCFSAYDLNLV